MFKVHSNLVWPVVTDMPVGSVTGFCVVVTPGQRAALPGCQPVLSRCLSVVLAVKLEYLNGTKRVSLLFSNSSSIHVAILQPSFLFFFSRIKRRRFISERAAGIPPCWVPASSLSVPRSVPLYVCLSLPLFSKKEEEGSASETMRPGAKFPSENMATDRIFLMRYAA